MLLFGFSFILDVRMFVDATTAPTAAPVAVSAALPASLLASVRARPWGPPPRRRQLAGDQRGALKMSLTRDFRLQVFFINQCPLGLWVSNWERLNFFKNSRR